MYYILREKTDNGRVDRIQSNSLEEATLFFMKRKQMNEQQAEKLAEQNISYINAQAEELAKHYRPQDLEKMKAVAKDAENEIKSQLEFYGDDISAFMRGGGLQHLKT